jgi:hypothetical protein
MSPVLKMPIGDIVDLIWCWKALLVFVGAGFITANRISIGSRAVYPSSPNAAA